MKNLITLLMAALISIGSTLAPVAYAKLEKPDFLDENAEEQAESAGAEISKWIGIVGGIVGLIMTGVGGILIMANKAEEGRKVITYAVIGGLIVGGGGGIYWAVVS